VILIGIMSAIALPSYFNQVEKARLSEAKMNLGSLNRAQQAYYFEKATFADQMSNLGNDLSTSNVWYTYSINPPINNTEVHHLANPVPEYAGDLKIMTSSVSRLGDVFVYTVCEGDAPGITPTIVNGSPTTCTNGQIIQ
jgi:type II secretory pathway pseudopilin PulG